jgi:hypothetical protein
MAFGGGNPFPFMLGGGPTDVESTHRTLRAMVGNGGAAAEGTIEDEWRFAKARGLAAAASAEGRAVHQFFPMFATDAIPTYEDKLGIVPPPEACEAERRQVVWEQWVKVISATASNIETELQKISPYFSVVPIDRKYTKTTIPGRYFEDHEIGDPEACGPAFGGGRTHTAFPNYSTQFVCYVQFDTGSTGYITESQKRLINRAKDLLNTVLPAWVGFQISQVTEISGDGFILDLSLLDLGAFNQ